MVRLDCIAILNMPRITRKKGLNEGEADSDSVDELNATICEQETATAPG